MKFCNRFEIILKKTFAIKYGENPSNHVSSKVFLSIWAQNIYWIFSYPKSKYQGCHIVKIEIEIKNIKLCLVFTHFYDIFIKILFFFQKQLSGWPYLIRPSVEFYDMYLILKDFVFLLKCNQWFAWKQSLHLPAYCARAVFEWSVGRASRGQNIRLCRVHSRDIPEAGRHASSTPWSPA